MDSPQIDQTGIPSAECINCGGTWFRIYATFDPDNYEVAAYLIDNAQCANCDAQVTVPTPIDLPEIADNGKSMYQRFLEIYNLRDGEEND